MNRIEIRNKGLLLHHRYLDVDSKLIAINYENGNVTIGIPGVMSSDLIIPEGESITISVEKVGGDHD